ncbi:hypothetical protein TWF730_009174 [Orbilia blumenaviensis]|uniref:Uncharacterized protein n=1 Tax=Orbilia blumenaviensis TaxID=1796055 RepID=A0AAV9V0S4_9PEZI
MSLHMVWGWHNDSIYSATEFTTTVSIPATAPITLENGGVKNYACHSKYETDLNYDERCMTYIPELCRAHPVWDEVLLNEHANYIWLKQKTKSKRRMRNADGIETVTSSVWSPDYLYIFEFFKDENCTDPSIDALGGPVKFLMDPGSFSNPNIVRVATYLLDAKLPVMGYWKGSRRHKLETPEMEEFEHKHHSGDQPTCEDPAHCTPAPRYIK